MIAARAPLDKDAMNLVKKLRLQKHPEGGYFKETYRSQTEVNVKGHEGMRRAATAIYYMLIGNQFSAFHRVKYDEIWHYYTGSSLILHIIIDDLELSEIKLGKGKGATFQAVIKANTWFAASLNNKKSYCLVGCTLSPGFEYDDGEIGSRDELIKTYPRHKKSIERYTII